MVRHQSYNFHYLLNLHRFRIISDLVSGKYNVMAWKIRLLAATVKAPLTNTRIESLTLLPKIYLNTVM
jgi:hypothetical protein